MTAFAFEGGYHCRACDRDFPAGPRTRSGCTDTDAAYVALDVDVLEPGEIAMFFPEPRGLSLAAAESLVPALVLPSLRSRQERPVRSSPATEH